MSVYFWMMIIGSGLLLAAFILSELFEWLDDLLESAFDWLHGGGDNAVYLSFRSLCAFFALFGSAGWLSTKYYGMRPELGLLPAILFGLVGLFLVGKLTKTMQAQAGSSELVEDDYVGATGIVVIAIPENDFGLVTLSVGGQTNRLSANSEDGRPIAYGKQVQVVKKEANVVIVKQM